MYHFDHFNFNVLDLERSLKFYDETLGLRPVREKDMNGNRLIFLGDGVTDFCLELTWLRGRTEPYDLGEQEFHLALMSDDIEASLEKHRAMGVVVQEPRVPGGFYFLEDPDGYWIEIIPVRK